MDPGAVVTRVNYYYITGSQYAGTSRQWGMTSDGMGVRARREGGPSGDLKQIAVSSVPRGEADSVGFANV